MTDTTTATTTTAPVYAIHESNWAGLEKKLSRVARKCAALGAPFVFEVVGEEYRTEKVHGQDVTARFVLVKAKGVARVADWEFVATLEYHDGGNIIRRYNDNIILPERFRVSPNVCEHCHTSRPRINLYIIHNVVTNEFKQVGGTCLSLYTHGLSLEYVTAWLDGVDALEHLDGAYDPEQVSNFNYYNVREVVAYAAALIKKTGYLKACDYCPTRDAVAVLLSYGTLSSKLSTLNGDGYLPKGIKLTADDMAVSDSEIDAILNYYSDLSDYTEFVHNIKAAISAQWVKPANLGILCYMPEGYYRHVAAEQERKEREEQMATERHEHYGEEGKRYKGVTVKSVREVAHYSTEYGITNIYNIVIYDNIVLTWKSTKEISTKEGAYSKIDFTVKCHGDYNGTPQTLVTRCKLY